jgi:hypothetical protein
MIRLTDATVIANNEAVAIVPNSLSYTEGLGEQDVAAASLGGGATEQVYSENVESACSKLMFALPTTPENIQGARAWKTNRNRNVFQIAGDTGEGEVTRTFQQASLTGDYEVNVGVDGQIDIEIKSQAAI